MKRLFIYASAIVAVLLAWSCQKEISESVSNGETSVNLSLEFPGVVQTKGISEAENTDIVYYEIWNSDWTKQLYPVDNSDLAYETVSNRKATIDLTLVDHQTYNFIFWAQNKDCGAYDVNDLKNVKIDYSVIASNGNSDKFDAFYAVEEIKVDGNIKQTVYLYRPFAQLNFGSDTMSSDLGKINVKSSSVTVKSIATVFNTLDGVGVVEEGQAGKSVTFKATGLAADKAMLETNGTEYTWVTMDYMLMTGIEDLVEVRTSFDLGMGTPVTHVIPNVPLKKNHRTNIVGDLFTSDAVLSVVVEPDFLLPDENITYEGDSEDDSDDDSVDDPVTEKVEAAVKFLVDVTPDHDTKSVSSAEKVDILYYEIWNSEWNNKLCSGSVPVLDKTVELEHLLAVNETYNYIFWAQNKACAAYDVTDLQNIGIDYSVLSAPGKRDNFEAYYSAASIYVLGPVSENVTLKRPFSQLNIGLDLTTSDLNSLTVGQTSVTTVGLATVFNTVQGVGMGDSEKVVFENYGLFSEDNLIVNSKQYTWLTMDYMFTKAFGQTYDFVISFDVDLERSIERSILNVPLMHGYRTNILGNLLESETDYVIVVEKYSAQNEEIIK